jgi:hypothetical protein
LAARLIGLKSMPALWPRVAEDLPLTPVTVGGRYPAQ